ncbi:3963_t:CDS:2 [Funneliformis geosporum]|nr:3963_t:CDS:2 [Funneliformis geosporum]
MVIPNDKAGSIVHFLCLKHFKNIQHYVQHMVQECPVTTLLEGDYWEDRQRLQVLKKSKWFTARKNTLHATTSKLFTSKTAVASLEITSKSPYPGLCSQDSWDMN